MVGAAVLPVLLDSCHDMFAIHHLPINAICVYLGENKLSVVANVNDALEVIKAIVLTYSSCIFRPYFGFVFNYWKVW